MSNAPNPDLINWGKNEKILKSRGKPRKCECGAIIVSKILLECPVCRALLPPIESQSDKDGK